MITIKAQYNYLEDAFDYLSGYAKFFGGAPSDFPDQAVTEMFEHVVKKTKEKLGRPYWNLNEHTDLVQAEHVISYVLEYLYDWYKGDWHLTGAGDATLMDALRGLAKS